VDGGDTTQSQSVVVNVQLSSCRQLISGDPPTWWELTTVTVLKKKNYFTECYMWGWARLTYFV
jgi:hypothetical protein